MNTKEKILEKAQELLLEKGYGNVSLTDIAAAVNISQPALYKHFKNKADLWELLAFNWLDAMLADLFPYKVDPKKSRSETIHDWFWTLASAKHAAYKAEPVMFKLYAEYLSTKPELVERHMNDLIDSLGAVSGMTDRQEKRCLIGLFSRFHHPMFADFWDEHTQDDFERTWKFVEPYFNTKTIL
ncbi:transcriptional regulator, TetR family [Paenibacillus sp. UNC496MF]|uniref:TetR/AcrR family transcriptional regulator n=1 Tax=Paenibacillus sp. UNC496MF TaxID=1502753 RepID=UPI0008EBFF72|nr:TetR/AcrR family transcriptional regulator [Paenibacillus sp. UNC496MF]SFJ83913.1 transcriptional regulator, TetR family [Paenibacillus sp. UNC496MF]